MQLLAAQVEEPVAQPRLLGILRLGVDLDRQRVGRRQHGQLGHRHLDLAGRQLGVDGRRRARHHLACHVDHALQPDRLGGGEGRAAGVEHALGQALVVAQVDEEQMAVVALAMDPAGQPGRHADVLGPQLAAGVGAIRRRRHPRSRVPVSGFTVTAPEASGAAKPQKP